MIAPVVLGRSRAAPNEKRRSSSERTSTAVPLPSKAACACGGGCPRCREKYPLQPKLEVSQAGDALEQEADRIAEQVLRMPQPEHPDKAQKGAGLRLSRCTSGLPARCPPDVPPVVHDVVRSPGEPLDTATRAFMEPRFGRDFGGVRVHFDAPAARSAAAMDALAFTVGQHVVFGRARYSPSGDPGRRLLAHELAHTVQQGGGRMLQRQPATGGGTTVAVQATGNCSVAQGSELTAAINLAMQWLRRAIQSLHEFEALPLSRGSAATRTALQFHFHTTNPFHAALIRSRLEQVRDGMTSPQGAPSDCAAAGDAGCGSATTAYHGQGQVFWCPGMFGRARDRQAHTIVHEYTHAQARRLPLTAGFAEFDDQTPRRIPDRAYLDRRYYLDLTPEEAMDNADSYAGLAEDLGTGRAGMQAPSLRAEDQMTGCSPAQQELIRQSLSMIARWNDAAEETLEDTVIPTFPILNDIVTDAIRRRFGTPLPARADLAAVYHAASSPLLLGFNLACDGATGSCQSPAVYLWQSGTGGTVHICPGWIAESDALTRHRTLYSQVLTNVGQTRGDLRRYIELARDLEGEHLATPEPPPPVPTDPFPQSRVPGTEIG